MKRIPDAQLHAMATSRGIAPGFVPKPERKRKKRDNIESRIQKSFRRWWDSICEQYGLDCRVLYAVPNGATLGGDALSRQIRGSILKDEGLRPNYPDMNFDVARCGYHGMRIEFKKPGEDPNEGQQSYHRLIAQQGYRIEVCRSAEEAINVVENYLK